MFNISFSSLTTKRIPSPCRRVLLIIVWSRWNDQHRTGGRDSCVRLLWSVLDPRPKLKWWPVNENLLLYILDNIVQVVKGYLWKEQTETKLGKDTGMTIVDWARGWRERERERERKERKLNAPMIPTEILYIIIMYKISVGIRWA